MSTSPRARARPITDSASAGSTRAGKSVTMSMRMAYRLQVEEALGRPDDDPAGGQIHVEHDLRHGRDEMLARAVLDDPEVLRRRRLDARHAADLGSVLRHHPAAFELPGVEAPGPGRQRLGLRDRAPPSAQGPARSGGPPA